MAEETQTEPTQDPQTTGETKGRTFADVLDSILSDKKRFLSALIMIVLIISISFGLVWIFFIKLFGLSPSQVQINTFGNQITLQTTSGDKKSTLIMVHPQGWEDTTIPVHKGQHVTFSAEGKVCIDSYSLVQAYKLMNDLERYYKEQVERNNNGRQINEQETPEQHYKDPVRHTLERCLDRLWTGPDGFREKNFPCPDFKDLGDPNTYTEPAPVRDGSDALKFVDQDFPGRTKHKVMPKEPYGELIGAVRTKENGDNVTKETFAIGSKGDVTISQDGELWLIVNDVIDEKDKEDSKYFYYDNVGFFIVTIETGRD